MNDGYPTHRTTHGHWLTREMLRTGLTEKRAGFKDGELHEVELSWSDVNRKYMVVHRVVDPRSQDQGDAAVLFDTVTAARSYFKGVTW